MAGRQAGRQEGSCLGGHEEYGGHFAQGGRVLSSSTPHIWSRVVFLPLPLLPLLLPLPLLPLPLLLLPFTGSFTCAL